MGWVIGGSGDQSVAGKGWWGSWGGGGPGVDE